MNGASDPVQGSPAPGEPGPGEVSPGPGDPISAFAVEALRSTLKAFHRAADYFTASEETEAEEAIHAARVAIRRMRTCIALFGSVRGRRPPRRVGRILKTAFKGLEGARDSGIVLGNVRAYAGRLLPRRAEELSGFVEDCLRSRDAALKRARRICGPAGVSTVRDAVREAEESFREKAATKGPAERDAPVILTREYRRLLGRGAPIGSESASASEYHAARRACKRFRYALEFLRGTLGPSADRLIADLRALQDGLGVLNDIFLTQDRIRSFSDSGAGGSAAASSRRSNPELTRYLAALQAEARRRCVGIPRRWGRIDSRGFRARFFASLLTPTGSP